MAQTSIGAAKIAAKNCGLSLDEFLDRRVRGNKKCTKCKGWKAGREFGRDGTRSDKKSTKCFACARVKERKNTKGRRSEFKGRKHTAAAKAAMSVARKGKPGPNKGMPRSPEVRAKISTTNRRVAKRGADSHSYIDGRAAERYGERCSIGIKRWRFDVYSRDGFMCMLCGNDCGGNLQAHHILPFATYPKLRTMIGNGVTLCKICHGGVHHFGLQFWSVVE